MTKPATHLLQTHRCADHDVEGPVSGPGSAGTLIGQMPATRLTDLAICLGGGAAPHLSPFATGAAMVLIDGLPAVRVGEKTLAGGEASGGLGSVLIGGDSFALPAFIEIDGSAEFQAKVLADLYRISSTRSGQMMFAAMARSGRRVRIQPCNKDHEKNEAEAAPKGSKDCYLPGSGTDAVIYFDPDDEEIKHYPKKYAPWAHPPNRPSDVSLFHEMVHAEQMMSGTLDKEPAKNVGPKRGDPISRGELRASGLEPYEEASYSENTYRDERGLPQRTYY